MFRSVHSMLALGSALALFAFAAACGTGRHAAPDSAAGQPDSGTHAAPAIPGLPAPAQLLKSSSSTPVLHRYGSQPELQAGVLISGNDAILGDLDETRFPYAVYRLNAANYQGEHYVRFVWDSDINAQQVWLGLGNFATNRWDLRQLSDDTLNYTPELHLSQQGDLLVALIVDRQGLTVNCRLAKLALGPNQAPVPQLQTRILFGAGNFKLKLDASSSYDPDGEFLGYQLEVEDIIDEEIFYPEDGIVEIEAQNLGRFGCLLTVYDDENESTQGEMPLDTGWLRGYHCGGTDAEANAVCALSDGSIIVAGSQNSLDAGRDATIMRLMTHPTPIWSKRLSSAGDERITQLKAGPNDTIYALGERDTPGGTVFLAKLDINGALLWERNWGAGQCHSTGGLELDGSGNAWFSARLLNDSGNDRLLLFKFTTNGDMEYVATYRGDGEELAGGVALGSGADLWFAGASTSFNIDGVREAVLLRYNRDTGALLNEHRYNIDGSSISSAPCLLYESTGTLFLGMGRPSAGGSSCLLLKVNETGTLLWQRETDPPGSSPEYEHGFTALALSTMGTAATLWAAGALSFNENGGCQGYVAGFDPATGTLTSQHRAGPQTGAAGALSNLAVHPLGGILLAGYAADYGLDASAVEVESSVPQVIPGTQAGLTVFHPQDVDNGTSTLLNNQLTQFEFDGTSALVGWQWLPGS